MGELPCSVKFVIEGEEETGSVHLPAFCAQGHTAAPRRPTPACGSSAASTTASGPCSTWACAASATSSCRSRPPAPTSIPGTGGSIFPNAAWRLVWALNTLKGPDERIRIPGFYDPFRAPARATGELMAALPEVADEYRQRYGVKHFLNGLTGGAELRIAEVFEPTCTICGLTSGYQGPGSKTVLPARASAKVDFRLVPDQTPEQVLGQFARHLDAEGFATSRSPSWAARPPAAPTRTTRSCAGGATPSRSTARPMQIVPMVGGSGRTIRSSNSEVAGRHGGRRLPGHPGPRAEREHPPGPVPEARPAYGAFYG